MLIHHYQNIIGIILLSLIIYIVTKKNRYYERLTSECEENILDIMSKNISLNAEKININNNNISSQKSLINELNKKTVSIGVKLGKIQEAVDEISSNVE